MEPFDEAEFWEEWIAAHERAAAEKARLEALGEEGVGEWMVTTENVYFFELPCFVQLFHSWISKLQADVDTIST